ncbi:MAG: competence/damage-inducible protein A [Deltaproteobacteria bacterium]|nr:MAG: competence/damage-inducible protein A [Deltaproteobacteria bacterium]
MSSAGILIIGNEILSGKVVDSNSPFLCRELRSLGVEVERISVIPDVVETIADEVRSMSRAYDYVFTSGGVGPTHDDLTMDGIALAFDVPIVRNEQLANRFRKVPNANESLMKMAMVPEGARLLDAGDLTFPVVVVANVHIFPGIPSLLQRKFQSIRERFAGTPFELRRVYVKNHESDIAASLHDVIAEFPDLMLGSYPRTGREAWGVLLTLESRDPDYVKRALDYLLKKLPPERVWKVE